MKLKELSFKEVEEIINTFLEGKSELYNRLIEDNPMIIGSIKKVFETIKAKVEEKECDVILNDIDFTAMKYLGIILPCLILEDKYDNLEDVVSAYILLIKNFTAIFKDDAGLLDSIKTTYTLCDLTKEYTRLITYGTIIANKLQSAIDMTNPSSLKLANTYMKELLNSMEE